jgi:hypothetical protein
MRGDEQEAQDSAGEHGVRAEHERREERRFEEEIVASPRAGVVPIGFFLGFGFWGLGFGFGVWGL